MSYTSSIAALKEGFMQRPQNLRLFEGPGVVLWPVDSAFLIIDLGYDLCDLQSGIIFLLIKNLLSVICTYKISFKKFLSKDV